MAGKVVNRMLALGLLGILLSGCATYHQPRYGVDGVYFDQWQAAPRQVVVVDPMIYPFWSLDFFYFGRFHHPYGSPFFVHDPWFFHDPWMHPRRGWATRVIWLHPVVYTAPPPDQRLWLMQEARSPARPARQAAWNDPGSEVQPRHRIAEDRAAAGRGGASGWTGTASTRIATDQGVRQPGIAPAPRPSQARPTTPSRQPAPAPRAQPQQRTREARSQAPAREVRAPAPTRANPNRERQIER